MKKTIYFIGGAASGCIVSFALTYLIGFTLQSSGIVLYASESDQQRNFNIFITLTCFISLLSGTWLSRKR